MTPKLADSLFQLAALYQRQSRFAETEQFAASLVLSGKTGADWLVEDAAKA
jgi:hypothetical protein